MCCFNSEAFILNNIVALFTFTCFYDDALAVCVVFGYSLKLSVVKAFQKRTLEQHQIFRVFVFVQSCKNKCRPLCD